ncbi:MAG TPA: alpha/beta fold hydrolase [Jatrophihabitans sp.]|jgi:pimeloyl-ACP methyl ester carboxylesterase
MSSFVLIPGAGGVAWYFSRLVPLLEQAGHRAIAVDLPGADETAGLPEYADLVEQAAGVADDVVLVAQSLGGFTAAVVAARRPVRGIVFVNAMIPNPGETPGQWGDAVDSGTARIEAAEQFGYSTDFDIETYFLHDVDPAVAAEGEPYQRPEADIVFESACNFDRWPDVPIRALAGAEDRLFPAEFQRRVTRERLGIDADVLPGGHLMALSNAPAVADYLVATGF